MNDNGNVPAPVNDTATQLHQSTLRLLRVLRTARPTKGLTLSRFAILGRLYHNGPGTATELAAYLRVRPQSLTRLVTDLEQHQLIARQSKGEDRRRNFLKITERGVRSFLDDIRGQRIKLAQTIEKELTPAEQELLKIAAGLVDRVAEAIETP